MRLLELFAGTKSVGRVAEERGWEVFSSDILPEFETDYTADVLDFDLGRVPWVPHVIWASPPCTAFSVASIGKHWTPPPENAPKDDAARLGLAIVSATLEIVDHFAALNPGLLWYMENPCGKLRVLSVVANLPRRVEVTYCQYGDTRMKRTDIWTNDMKWVARPMCAQGASCHESAPRGAKTGTQGLAYVDRSRIPPALCEEVLESAESQIGAGTLYCSDCGDEMVDVDGSPRCVECDDVVEDVPCDHPCSTCVAAVGGPVEDCEGRRWALNADGEVVPLCEVCGAAMKDYEDGDGYCCPACGTDDGSGAYRGAD